MIVVWEPVGVLAIELRPLMQLCNLSYLSNWGCSGYVIIDSMFALLEMHYE